MRIKRLSFIFHLLPVSAGKDTCAHRGVHIDFQSVFLASRAGNGACAPRRLRCVNFKTETFQRLSVLRLDLPAHDPGAVCHYDSNARKLLIFFQSDRSAHRLTVYLHWNIALRLGEHERVSVRTEIAFPRWNALDSKQTFGIGLVPQGLRLQLSRIPLYSHDDATQGFTFSGNTPADRSRSGTIVGLLRLRVGDGKNGGKDSQDEDQESSGSNHSDLLEGC